MIISFMICRLAYAPVLIEPVGIGGSKEGLRLLECKVDFKGGAIEGYPDYLPARYWKTIELNGSINLLTVTKSSVNVHQPRNVSQDLEENSFILRYCPLSHQLNCSLSLGLLQSRSRIHVVAGLSVVPLKDSVWSQPGRSIERQLIIREGDDLESCLQEWVNTDLVIRSLVTVNDSAGTIAYNEMKAAILKVWDLRTENRIFAAQAVAMLRDTYTDLFVSVGDVNTSIAKPHGLVPAAWDQQIPWMETSIQTLDIIDDRDFKDIFTSTDSIDRFKAEHVLEHLSLAEAVSALQNMLSYLKPGGTVRIAVPDYHWMAAHLSEEELLVREIRNDHKVQYTAWTLIGLLESVGFDDVTAFEWTDSNGTFHSLADELITTCQLTATSVKSVNRCKDVIWEKGYIRRSSRGSAYGASMHSLIVDGIKPLLPVSGYKESVGGMHIPLEVHSKQRMGEDVIRAGNGTDDTRSSEVDRRARRRGERGGVSEDKHMRVVLDCTDSIGVYDASLFRDVVAAMVHNFIREVETDSDSMKKKTGAHVLLVVDDDWYHRLQLFNNYSSSGSGSLPTGDNEIMGLIDFDFLESLSEILSSSHQPEQQRQQQQQTKQQQQQQQQRQRQQHRQKTSMIISRSTFFAQYGCSNQQQSNNVSSTVVITNSVCGGLCSCSPAASGCRELNMGLANKSKGGSRSNSSGIEVMDSPDSASTTTTSIWRSGPKTILLQLHDRLSRRECPYSFDFNGVIQASGVCSAEHTEDDDKEVRREQEADDGHEDDQQDLSLTTQRPSPLTHTHSAQVSAEPMEDNIIDSSPHSMNGASSPAVTTPTRMGFLPGHMLPLPPTALLEFRNKLSHNIGGGGGGGNGLEGDDFIYSPYLLLRRDGCRSTSKNGSSSGTREEKSHPPPLYSDQSRNNADVFNKEEEEFLGVLRVARILAASHRTHTNQRNKNNNANSAPRDKSTLLWLAVMGGCDFSDRENRELAVTGVKWIHFREPLNLEIRRGLYSGALAYMLLINNVKHDHHMRITDRRNNDTPTKNHTPSHYHSHRSMTPLYIIEAMACGCPVITSEGGGRFRHFFEAAPIAAAADASGSKRHEGRLEGSDHIEGPLHTSMMAINPMEGGDDERRSNNASSCSNSSSKSKSRSNSNSSSSMQHKEHMQQLRNGTIFIIDIALNDDDCYNNTDSDDDDYFLWFAARKLLADGFGGTFRFPLSMITGKPNFHRASSFEFSAQVTEKKAALAMYAETNFLGWMPLIRSTISIINAHM